MIVSIQRLFCLLCDKTRTHEVVSDLAKCVVCETVQDAVPDTGVATLDRTSQHGG